jgi:Mn2+/Fe2+ NRAMP family transporter
MKNNFLKTLGPGILFASTAIGVSHLVQSTRAGADYGFALVGFIILANLMKYPFFEYASRYANAKHESIIDGYKRIGEWMLWLYILITIGSMFFVTAAVGFVTAGFLDNLFGINDPLLTSIILFVVCVLILTIGNFKTLDGLIKLITSVLLISTIIAFIVALVKGPAETLPNFVKPQIYNETGILFLIALMGWMPTALDLSSWNSLWTLERIKQTNYQPKLKETLFEFNLGYLVSAVLAICFVTLGAYLVYGTGVQMPAASHLFASQVVQLYTQTIGHWSYFIIAAAAFSIMFGTSIAVFDGYSRALQRCFQLVGLKTDIEQNTLNKSSYTIHNQTSNYSYKITLLVLSLGSFIIIWQFAGDLKKLVDLATSISFLVSPIIAIVNFRLVSKRYLDEKDTPPLWMKVLSYLGIIFLFGFSFCYIYYQFL